MSTSRTFLIEPFDIMLHATEDGVQYAASAFLDLAANLVWRSALFVLADARHARRQDRRARRRRQTETDDDQRRGLLIEYRREYERMNTSAEYQRALCGMALWNDQNPARDCGWAVVGIRYARDRSGISGAVRGTLRITGSSLLASRAVRSSGWSPLLGGADQLRIRACDLELLPSPAAAAAAQLPAGAGGGHPQDL